MSLINQCWHGHIIKSGKPTLLNYIYKYACIVLMLTSILNTGLSIIQGSFQLRLAVAAFQSNMFLHYITAPGVCI